MGWPSSASPFPYRSITQSLLSSACLNFLCLIFLLPLADDFNHFLTTRETRRKKAIVNRVTATWRDREKRGSSHSLRVCSASLTRSEILLLIGTGSQVIRTVSSREREAALLIHSQISFDSASNAESLNLNLLTSNYQSAAQ